MTTVKLNNYRQAPRKVRLVADLIRGKGVVRAHTILSFAGKRAGAPIQKLLASAVAAAKDKDSGIDKESLSVSEIRVDKGFTYKRMRPRAFGRGAPIHKETCHVTLTIGQGKSKIKDQKSK